MSPSVLLVEDDDAAAASVERAMSRASRRTAFTLERVSTLGAVLGRLHAASTPFAAVVLSLRRSESDVLATLTSVRADTPDLAVVVLVAEDRAELGARAAELGAQEHVVMADGTGLEALPLSITYACERVRREREIQELLTRRRQVEGALAASAGLTAVGSLVAGLAHEINNPLAVILANLEESARMSGLLAPHVAEAGRADFAELRQMLDEAQAATQRVQLVIRDLRAFSGSDERTSQIDLNTVIEGCCHIAAPEIRRRARLVRDLNATVPILGNQAKLAQVFLNLLLNAAHAMPDGMMDRGEISISTKQEGDGRAAIVVEVSDNGTGISPAHAALVFEPFFTTRPRRPGMGLPICRATVQAHGGEITIHPREGGGTIVRVVLPTVEAKVQPGAVSTAH
jgi:signal transduction histidine kinase